MFRISWRYVDTGMIGHGSYVFHSFEHALAIAEAYNRRHPHLIHYVEVQPAGEGNILGAGAD